MSIVDVFRRDEQRVLDRLVDGELGQLERRTLLAALDDEPGAWRRCALAFLESQNFRWQLTRLAADATLAKPRQAGAVEILPIAKRVSFWGVCLAAAASLIVAFGLGTRFGRPAPAIQSASDPSGFQVADATSDDGEPSANNVDDQPETVTLTLTGDEQHPDKIELPVAASQDDQWRDELESDLPSGLFEQLRAAGLEVVRRQRLFGVDLSDGRRLVVPVEQVDIRQPALMEDL